MIPTSLSASSLLVWTSCPSRWEAEYFNRARTPSGTPADLGTACHGALEDFVGRCVQPDGGVDPWESVEELYRCFEVYHDKFFPEGHPDRASAWEDGYAMLTRWHERQDWNNRTVLSREVKENFLLKTSAGEIPFNYIWDRCDRLADGSIEVVDYKTIRQMLSPDGLRDKIQARLYGVAAQIKYPDAPRVWVTFDLLRYDPVGIVYSRDDNIATWRFLQRKAEEIISTAEGEAPEQINPECRWCVRRQGCESLLKVARAGGGVALTDPAAAVRRLGELTATKSALEANITELESFVLGQMEADDVLSETYGDWTAEVTAKRTRTVDAAMAARIIGSDLMAQYGSLTMGVVDTLLKGDQLAPEQKQQLKALIGHRFGEPKIKVKPVNPIDES